jgi:hypothetical protein
LALAGNGLSTCYPRPVGIASTAGIAQEPSLTQHSGGFFVYDHGPEDRIERGRQLRLRRRTYKKALITAGVVIALALVVWLAVWGIVFLVMLAEEAAN